MSPAATAQGFGTEPVLVHAASGPGGPGGAGMPPLPPTISFSYPLYGVVSLHMCVLPYIYRKIYPLYRGSFASHVCSAMHIPYSIENVAQNDGVVRKNNGGQVRQCAYDANTMPL